MINRLIEIFMLTLLISTNADFVFSQPIKYTGLGKLPTADSAVVFAPGLIYLSNRFGKADLNFSKFENNKYVYCENLDSIINTEYNEWDPFISPDNMYLIFKSDRPGGYGQYDMYVSLMIDNKWTIPKNLGLSINTLIEDDTGNVTPDGKYFTFYSKEILGYL